MKISPNKKICAAVLFFAGFPLYTGDFSDLYTDLANYWHMGRRPVYLGMSYYVESFGMNMWTGNETDFIISGSGFFVVHDAMNDRKLLTRNGRFLFDSRMVLINDDGYFVLGYDGGYINYQKIDMEKKSFKDEFLIVMPLVDTVISISNKYLTAVEYMPVKYNAVYNKFLEAMPVSLDMLIDAALPDVENNRGYSHKQELVNLFYTRYHEIKEIAAAPEDYYAVLLEKIKRFEERLGEVEEK